MAHFAAAISSFRLRSAVLVGLLALGAACSTLHEADLAANRGYNEFGTPAYKPKLATNAKSAPAARNVSRVPKRNTQYSPMVARTATGVRVVQDFSTQAKKNTKPTSAQARAARTQQNTKLTKSYNSENLLNR